jgi:hypothetical protein
MAPLFSPPLSEYVLGQVVYGMEISIYHIVAL